VSGCDDGQTLAERPGLRPVDSVARYFFVKKAESFFEPLSSYFLIITFSLIDA